MAAFTAHFKENWHEGPMVLGAYLLSEHLGALFGLF